jgi:hypothetical protein
LRLQVGPGNREVDLQIETPFTGRPSIGQAELVERHVSAAS